MPDHAPPCLLTTAEGADFLRCSRSHLSGFLNGGIGRICSLVVKAKRSIHSPLFTFRRPEVVSEPADHLFRLDLEYFANPEEREQSDRAAGLNHLPVTHAEAVRHHILLRQMAFRTVTADAMPQRTEIVRVTAGKFSGGAHYSKVGPHEQKYHEQKDVMRSLRLEPGGGGQEICSGRGPVLAFSALLTRAR